MLEHFLNGQNISQETRVVTQTLFQIYAKIIAVLN